MYERVSRSHIASSSYLMIVRVCVWSARQPASYACVATTKSTVSQPTRWGCKTQKSKGSKNQAHRTQDRARQKIESAEREAAATRVPVQAQMFCFMIFLSCKNENSPQSCLCVAASLPRFQLLKLIKKHTLYLNYYDAWCMLPVTPLRTKAIATHSTDTQMPGKCIIDTLTPKNSNAKTTTTLLLVELRLLLLS